MTETEDQITYKTNNEEKHCECCCVFDNEISAIEVYNASGYKLGYSWRYGDTVKLDLNLNYTSLHVCTEENLELLKIFLTNKNVLFVFSDIRGNVVYEVESNISGINSTIELNTTEENTLERNTYSLQCYLLDHETNSRTSLLKTEYIIYVA